MKNAFKYGIAYDVTVHGCGEAQKVKDESERVAADNQADSTMVSLIVSRIPPRYAKGIRNARTAIYNYLNKAGISVNGQILVPFSKQAAFEEGLEKLVAEYKAHVAVLLDACNSGELAQELSKLGDLQDEVKSLNCNDIAARFGVTIRRAVDFSSPAVVSALASMESEAVYRLREQVEADAQAAHNEALTEISGFVAGRISNLLKKLVQKVGVKGTRIKYLLADIREIVEDLLAYNVLNDSKVAETIGDIQRFFGSLTDDDLRDEAQQTVIKSNAKTLLEKFG